MVWAIWTVIGLLLAQQSYVIRLATGGGAPAVWWRLVVYSVAGAWLWAAVTPGIVHLTRRFPLHGRQLLTSVWVHVLAALALNVIDAAATELRAPIVGNRSTSIGMLAARLIFSNLTLYVGVAGVATAMDFARLYRERAVAAAELAAQLSRAQLRALQSQLRPHFLFNTLNTIAEQLHTDPAGADRMIMRLGALLRASLSFSEQHEIPLREELRTLADYLEIMSVRHRDRLTICITPGAGTEEALVPAMVLQPLVENAIHHGVEPSERPTRVTIRSARDGGRLVLTVEDDGEGLPNSGMREGIGIGNTRERLRQLHGDAAQLTVKGRDGGGVRCEVVMPYRSA